MRDITGFSIPQKPVVRFGADGYRAKIWYRNGHGMLWRWTFYFTDGFPTLVDALEEGRRIADEAAHEVDRQKELETLMMRGMGASVNVLLDRRGGIFAAMAREVLQ